MKARQLIAAASFGPQQLNVIYQAFDEAWEAIAASTDPVAVESTRLKLANIVLSLAAAGNDDPQALKNAALRLLS